MNLWHVLIFIDTPVYESENSNYVWALLDALLQKNVPLDVHK